MKRILIRKRSGDYIAQVEGNQGQWDCGPTAMHAIGNLIRTWPESFDIDIVYENMPEPAVEVPRRCP